MIRISSFTGAGDHYMVVDSEDDLDAVAGEVGDVAFVLETFAMWDFTGGAWTARAAVLQALSEKGQADGYAGLDGAGLVPLAQLPGLPAAPHATTHQSGGTDPLSLGLLAGSLAIGQVPDDLITYAKLQNVSATDKLLGRATGGAGDVEEVPCTAAGRALLDDADAAAQRTTLGLAAVAASGSAGDLGSGILPDARMPNLTGDVTTAEGAVATTIADNAVTLAKLADIATARILGRTTAGSGDPEALTATQATALLDVFTSALKGLVPASGGGTVNFLRADGVYAQPPGTGGLTRINGATGAAGADITLQKLSADAAANATTTLAVVMTTQTVGVGVWSFKYLVRYRAGATTTGVDFAVNHTGTVAWITISTWFVTSGGAAATALADQVTNNTANLVEGKAQRAKDAKVGASLGVDTANADCLMVIEGIVEVTASGDLELKHCSEVAASSQVMAGSCLQLTKIG